ncbi:hypothetical protein BGZ75_000681 [Mortierella antarctica]|nr:hypothetical protein BGZ75_000681 [Mortierella antarctica]
MPSNKGMKKKEDDDDTVPRFRISARAARNREYGMEVGSSTGHALQQQTTALFTTWHCPVPCTLHSTSPSIKANMAEKLQEKFALVQQMKREKELKEARAKESQPFDIFSIAGVNLPSSGNSGGLNMTIRHDSQGSGAPSVGSVKRPRKERTQSSSSDMGQAVPSTGATVVEEESTGQKTKLKRSSMAARNGFQDPAVSVDVTERVRPSTDTSIAAGLIDQTSEISSATDTSGGDNLDNTLTATPLTPIASPKTDAGSRRNSGSASPTKMLAKDMTHNVQSRSGSVDENEEMVIDMFGRSVPRSRHHSSDEGSDSENETA